ncbi:MAG TPA: hypothetical protein DCG49_10270 [Ruminococcus sp.]|nr:hypothetical protein [Ruminococcus sp.]
MKKIGMQMNICLSITLSFVLTLIGVLRHFTIIGFLLSFILSLIISFAIGCLLPMPRIRTAVCKKANAAEHSKKGNLVCSLVSDLIYTIPITICNVFLGYRQAASHGADVSFLRMLIPSLLISLVVAFVLLYFATPFFLNRIIAKNGLPPIQTNRPSGE